MSDMSDMSDVYGLLSESQWAANLKRFIEEVHKRIERWIEFRGQGRPRKGKNGISILLLLALLAPREVTV